MSEASESSRLNLRRAASPSQGRAAPPSTSNAASSLYDLPPLLSFSSHNPALAPAPRTHTIPFSIHLGQLPGGATGMHKTLLNLHESQLGNFLRFLLEVDELALLSS